MIKKLWYTNTVLLLPCLTMNISAHNKKPLVIAHRGASMVAPENTLAACQAALDLGVDMIEFDVFVCKSGQVMVIHDDTVDRTTNGTGYINQLTFDQLRALRVENEHIIPTLHEWLFCMNRRALAAIEIKSLDGALPTAYVVKEFIEQYGWQPTDFYILSFNHEALMLCKQIIPDVPLCATTVSTLVNHFDYIQTIGVQAVCIAHQQISKEFIEKAHNNNIKVFTYTVNRPDQIVKMITLQVDGIMADCPEYIQSALHNKTTV